MNIRLATCADEVSKIVKREDIWALIAQDGQSPDGWEPDLQTDLWLIVESNGDNVGAYCFDNLKGICCEIHPYILPEYRSDVGRESIHEGLEFLFNQAVNVSKVIAFIPTCYKAVYNYAIKSGFVCEGVSRESFLKNGEIWDMWLVGITRGNFYERS